MTVAVASERITIGPFELVFTTGRSRTRVGAQVRALPVTVLPERARCRESLDRPRLGSEKIRACCLRRPRGGLS